MAGNAPSNDLHILKIPLAFFGLHRGTADPQAVQRLENYIAKLKKELHRHALKAIEAPNYFLPEDFKQALSAMPIALFRVGNEFEMPVDCAAILFEHAYLAFHAYRQRPQEEQIAPRHPAVQPGVHLPPAGGGAEKPDARRAALDLPVVQRRHRHHPGPGEDAPVPQPSLVHPVVAAQIQ